MPDLQKEEGSEPSHLTYNCTQAPNHCPSLETIICVVVSDMYVHIVSIYIGVLMIQISQSLGLGVLKHADLICMEDEISELLGAHST